jgi:hypothetical protein
MISKKRTAMRIRYLSFLLLLILVGTVLNAQFPRFRALAY